MSTFNENACSDASDMSHRTKQKCTIRGLPKTILNAVLSYQNVSFEEMQSSCTGLARNSGLNGIILYTSLYGARLCEREERRGAAHYRRATVRTGVGCRAREQQDGRGREWEAAEWCVLRARRIRSIHRQTTRSR